VITIIEVLFSVSFLARKSQACSASPSATIVYVTCLHFSGLSLFDMALCFYSWN